MLKHSNKIYFHVKYADSQTAGLKYSLCKMRLEHCAITPTALVPGSLLVAEERAHNSRPSHPFLSPASLLSDSVYICLSVWFGHSLISSELPGPAEARDSSVDLWALSQASSEGNYLKLAGYLMRFAMIYAALCTENRIRDLCVGSLLINSTL